MSTFWDGAGGAIIGAALSGIFAVVAIVWTRRDQQDLMREQMSIRAAYELLAFTYEVRRRMAAGCRLPLHRPDRPRGRGQQVGRLWQTDQAGAIVGVVLAGQLLNEDETLGCRGHCAALTTRSGPWSPDQPLHSTRCPLKPETPAGIVMPSRT